MGSDYINRNERVFNRPGELFNDNAPVPTVRRFIPQTEPPDDATPFPSAPERPTVRSDFPVPAPPRSPVRKIVAGSFSTVRASRTVHQHAVSLWGEDYLPSHVGRSSVPDPSPAELTQQYQDLRLFSYLPPQIMPSQDEFIQAATPSLRGGFLAERLEDMGIETAGEDENPPALESAETGVSQMRLVAPFAPVINRGCAERLESLLGVSNA